MSTRTKNFFRWVLFIPAAFLMSALYNSLAQLILFVPLWLFGVKNDAPIFTVVAMIGSAIGGYFFVYFGTRVAPNYKPVVILALAALGIFLGGIGITIAIFNEQTTLALEEFCSIIGICFFTVVMMGRVIEQLRLTFLMNDRNL